MFEIALRHHIWHVTLDRRFFADFRSQQQAHECVARAVSALCPSGGAVRGARQEFGAIH